MEHRFFEVDVFATAAFSGNPVAVVADADGLSEDQMLQIARWTNFSETTFLLRPTHPAADYRLRIFTPHEEFDFAGHPTLGSARVFAELSGRTSSSSLIQECGLGLITVQHSDDVYSFATPPLRKSGPLEADDIAATCSAFALDPAEVLGAAWVDNGPGWRLLHLTSAARVRSVCPGELGGMKVGLVGFFEGTEAKDTADLYEVRAFTPEFEDPVTGSFNGGAAQYLREQGLVPDKYTVAQGRNLHRAGRVHIHDDGKDIWVGGSTQIRVHGTLSS